jgi:hypothetical protein
MLQNMFRRSFSTFKKYYPKYIEAPKIGPKEYIISDVQIKVGDHIQINDYLFKANKQYDCVSNVNGFIIKDYVKYPQRRVTEGKILYEICNDPLTEEDDIQIIYNIYQSKMIDNQYLEKNELFTFKYIANVLKNDDVYWNCAMAFYNDKNYDEAKKATINMDRNYPRLTFLKGLIEFNQDNIMAASNFFDQSNDDDGYYGKSLIYDKYKINEILSNKFRKDIPDLEIKK